MQPPAEHPLLQQYAPCSVEVEETPVDPAVVVDVKERVAGAADTVRAEAMNATKRTEYSMRKTRREGTLGCVRERERERLLACVLLPLPCRLQAKAHQPKQERRCWVPSVTHVMVL